MSTVPKVSVLVSALELLIGKLTPELMELFERYLAKVSEQELDYEDYAKLADVLEKVAAKSRDTKQKASLMKLLKLWRERARMVAHHQLLGVRERADMHLRRGQVEDVAACFKEAVALGEKVEDQSAAAYIANTAARHYLNEAHRLSDRTYYVKAIKWFERSIDMSPEDYNALLGLSYSLAMSGRLEEAVEASDRATKVNENGVEGWYNKGLYLMRLDKDQEALVAFEKGIKVDRTYPPVWRAKAELLTKMKKFEESISCYDEYLELESNEPDLASAWNDKGNVYYDHIRGLREAEKCYQEALKVRADHKHALYNLGLVCMQREDWEQAKEKFGRALEVDSSYANAWYWKGRACESMNDFEEAVLCYDRLVPLEPTLEEAWFRLGYSRYMLGRYEEAIEAYDHAIEFKKDNEITWHNKALCLELLGRYDAAIKCYAEAIGLNRKYSKALRGLARMLELIGRYEEAVIYLERLTKLEPKNPDLWNWRGNIYHDYLKKHQEAVNCYKKAVQLDPKYKYAWYNMGRVYSTLEKDEKAIEAYKKATEVDPNYRDAWYWKAKVEQKLARAKLKRFDEALKSYRKCVELDPKDGVAWFGIGYALGGLRNHKDAIKAYTEVLRLNKRDTAAWGNKGYNYRMLGKFKNAIKCYDKVLEINPNDTYALDGKAVALRISGSKREALSTIERFLALKPKDSNAWAEKALILRDQRKHEDALEAAKHALELDSKNVRAWTVEGALLFDDLNKVEEAYECFQRASELEPSNPYVVTNIPEALMVLERHDEARSKAHEILKMDLEPSQVCVMRFIVFTTLLLEDKEKEGRAELNELLQFYRTTLRRRKIDWTFRGTRRFLNASTSKHRRLMLRVIDLFERKLNLTEFRKEAKRHLPVKD